MNAVILNSAGANNITWPHRIDITTGGIAPGHVVIIPWRCAMDCRCQTCRPDLRPFWLTTAGATTSQ